MDNSEIFLEKFKQLEEAVRTTYRIREADSITYYLTGQVKYKRFADELKYCQKVRNFLVHENKINDQFAVDASDAMIKFIDDLIAAILNQPKCSDIQIKLRDVYWRGMQDTVKQTMSVMRQKLYTHVPILDVNGKVLGVFDENSVFMYLADQEIVSVDDTLRFSDIREYLSTSNREMETFVFVKPSVYVEELETIVEKAFDKGQRVGLAFVTASGKPNDRLQGIITPWDMINANEND